MPRRRFRSEHEFRQEVTKLAKAAGWEVCFIFRGKTAKGEWRTNTTSKGYPDLTLCKTGRLVFLELKVGTNQPSAEQSKWIAMLQTVAPLDGTVEAYVVWPSDWEDIVEVLTR